MAIKKITAKQLYEKMQKNEQVQIIDVRAEEKYNEYHMEAPALKVQNIPKTTIFKLEETGESLSLPKKEEFVIACTTGNSAAKCANILAARDYHVVVLEGGLTAWKEYILSLKESNESNNRNF